MKRDGSTLVLWEEPTQVDLKLAMSVPAEPLWVSGIFNPFGPTVNVIATSGIARCGQELPLLLVSLNPFSGSLEQIGTVTIGRRIGFEQLIEQFAPVVADWYCPTFVMHHRLMTRDVAASAVAKLLAHHIDVDSTARMLHAFPGQPWERATAQLDQAMLGQNEDARQPSLHSTKLGADDLKRLASMMLQDDYLQTELEALVSAWAWAIAHDQRGFVEVDVKTFHGVFGFFTDRCRFPN